MRVPVTIFEFTVDAIIDSGAEVTVLSQRVFNSLPEDRRWLLQKAEKGLVVAEENRVMPAVAINSGTISGQVVCLYCPNYR